VSDEYHLEQYNRIIREYCRRGLSYSSDALNACSAVLNRLEGAGFPQGFRWGPPLDYPMSGLLWTSSDNPMRRREGFPSWSWVGWVGGFQECPSRDNNFPTEYSPPLRVWAYKNNIRTLILEISKGRKSPSVGFKPTEIHHNTIVEINSTIERSGWKVPEFNLENYTEVERENLLLIQGIICDMTITSFRASSKNHTKAHVEVN
jgi:hypothetical protein